MGKITVAEVVQAATKRKSVSVGQIHKFAERRYPLEDIKIKDINNYLYGEYYDNSLYGSVEKIERIF